MPDLSSWFVSKSQDYQLNKKVNLSSLKNLISKLSIKPPKKIISITGTNGKGSTAFLINQVLSKKYKVGYYSSPHLVRPNERIIIKNKYASDSSIKESFKIIEEINNKELNFYQLFSLAAFNLFSKNDLDVWILEAGIGGRLDPINCFDADISIITNLALDHEEILGDDLEKIGYEKSGILRKKQSLVYGDNFIPKSISKKIDELKVNFLQNKKDFFLKKENNFYEWNNIKIENCNIHSNSLALGLQTIELIDETLINDSLFKLKSPIFKGRCHLIGNKFLVDVAHNENAAIHLRNFIKSNNLNNRKIYAVFSCSHNKNIEDIIKPFIDIVSSWAIPKINNDRLASQIHLKSLFKEKFNIEISLHKSLKESLDLYNKNEENPLILIFGSFYLAGEFYKEETGLNV